ncbi:MAG: hypothetical protein ACTHLX_15810 [Candidatus Binatia bacterium]
MKSTVRSLVLGGLVAGGLLASTTPVFARDYWHWSREYKRWDHRADLRSDYHDLEEAKRQLERDRSRHASRHTLTNDEARIRDIEHDIHDDRRALK